MRKLLHTICLLMLAVASFAEPAAPPAQQTSPAATPVAIDARLQSLKQDVLKLSEQLSRIEQQLLYPADTHINIFVSLPAPLDVQLESVRLEMDGKRVASHLYTDSENRALQNGGVQRIYTGNVTPGKHLLQFELVGQAATGGEIRIGDSLSFEKGERAAFVEVQIIAAGDVGIGLQFQTE